MLQNHVSVAWRNLLKHKFFSFINLSGLVVGLTTLCCISLYVLHEATYDRHHPQNERLFRVLRSDSAMQYIPGVYISSVLAPTFREKVAGIEKLARLQPHRTAVLKKDNAYFAKEGFQWADPETLQLFDLPLAHGNAGQALLQPNALVLTMEAALKYFGRENALGEVLQLDTLTLTVTGVFKALPTTTHLDFTMLGSFATLGKIEGWRQQGHVYVRLQPNATAGSVARVMAREAMKASYWFPDHYEPYTLQPVREVHLRSGGFMGHRGGNDVKYLYIFGIVALVIALSTAFNYINLATARFTERVKEVGVRKAVGATRSHLVSQFLAESLLFSLLAFGASIALLLAGLPWLGGLLGVPLTRQFGLQLPVLGLLLGLAVLLGLLAGVYPALFLSGFKPVQVLKGINPATGNGRVRQRLMSLQFAVTITLLAVTVFVSRQLRHVSNQKLGFEKEQVLVLTTPASDRLPTARIKEALLQIPAVRNVTAVSSSPLEGGAYWYDTLQGKVHKISYFKVDEDFVKTLEMKVVQGRNFSTRFGTDAGQALLINETLAKALGWKQLAGQQHPMFGSWKVVGVVKDFHLGSLHEPVNPAYMVLEPNQASTKDLLVRVQTRQIGQRVADIERAWKKTLPNFPLRVSFLSGQYEALYRSEMRLRNLILLFAGLAIFIGCLGLLGLAAFTVGQRTKEIGIRKVMGASVPQILVLLSGSYVKMIGWAFLLAVPLAWYLTRKWLESFADRIAIDPLVFVGVGLLMLTLALLTIGFHLLKFARANPVQSLRSE
jgi:putative ABC transport system permease protein